MKISVPISVGELLDKISILQIKNTRIKDQDKLMNIRHELELLEGTVTASEIDDLICPKILTKLRAELKNVNQELWSIEDALRVMETKREFGVDFVTAARKVYEYNDHRAEIKRKINELTGSELVEEKHYSE